MKNAESSRVSPPARGGARGGGSGVGQFTHPTQPPLEKGRRILMIVGLGSIAVAFFLFRSNPCTNFHEAILQTPTQKISLALANTPEKQSRGLGGCRYIPNYAGMYFPFNPAQATVFWMKDMRIPIDIIWIKNGVIIAIEKNVPNEPKNTPDSSLKTYTSPGEIDAVLEVEEGKAHEYGIIEGSRVNLT